MDLDDRDRSIDSFAKILRESRRFGGGLLENTGVDAEPHMFGL